MPHPYDMKKKQVCPSALKVLKIKPYRKFCVLGDLATKFGWKSGSLVSKLEEKRVARAGNFYKKKLTTIKAKKGGRST